MVFIKNLIRVAVFLSILGIASSGWAQTVTMTAERNFEVVYNWKKDHCDKWMIPDAPARAFIDADGTARLFAANESNWYMVGKNLASVRSLCNSAYESGKSPNPRMFDGHGWIESTFTRDGKTIVGLISSDWWPTSSTAEQDRPPGCNVVGPINCHYYAINIGVSRNGGESFSLVPKTHVLAKVPYKEFGAVHRILGFATATNLFQKDSFIYAFLGLRASNKGESGSCLFRTRSPSSLEGWEAWNGGEFVPESNLVSGQGAAEECKPVSVPFPSPVEFRSVNFFADCACYVGMFEGARVGKSGALEDGFFYTTSIDLVTWSMPQLVVTRPQDKECKPMLVYPSLLDPTSKDRNFSSVSSNPYIYFTRINRIGCHGTTDRDLLRVQVQLTPSH